MLWHTPDNLLLTAFTFSTAVHYLKVPAIGYISDIIYSITIQGISTGTPYCHRFFASVSMAENTWFFSSSNLLYTIINLLKRQMLTRRK